MGGETQWIEVRSPNFRIYTDGGEKRGREVATHFEQMRFVFGRLFQKAKLQTGMPVEVIAFRNAKEFRAVAPLWKGKAKDAAGFFIQGQGVAFIAIDLSSSLGWATVFHEYAHLLMNSNIGRAPPWFDEGFAEYYQTARFEKSEWVIGELPQYAVRQLASDRFYPLEQLFAAGHDSPIYNERDRTSMFYAQSWLAVEYFWFDPARNKQLLRYFELLDSNVTVHEAMKQAFGKEPVQLDKDFLSYFRRGQVRIAHFKLPPVFDNLDMKVTPLAALDARAIISELRLNEQGYQQQAMAELADILRQNPDHPIALRGMGYASLLQGDPKKGLPYLERAVTLGSDEARVYFYWALALEQANRSEDGAMQEKMRSALERCLALNPQMAEAYSLLALLQSSRNDFDGAIKSMKTAIALHPNSEENYLSLANLYLNWQKLDEAAALLQSLSHSSTEVIAAQARTMMESVERARKWSSTHSQAKPSMGDR